MGQIELKNISTITKESRLCSIKSNTREKKYNSNNSNNKLYEIYIK